jgi:hypothetical protein
VNLGPNTWSAREQPKGLSELTLNDVNAGENFFDVKVRIHITCSYWRWLASKILCQVTGSPIHLDAAAAEGVLFHAINWRISDNAKFHANRLDLAGHLGVAVAAAEHSA